MPGTKPPSDHAASPRSKERLTGWWIGALAIGLSIAAFALLSQLGGRGDPELLRRIEPLHTVAFVAETAPRGYGDNVIAATRLPMLAAALDRNADDDPRVLTQALSDAKTDGLLVGFDARAKGDTIGAQLQRFESVRGLRGEYLTERWALYVPDPLQALPTTLQQALSTVARGMLGGERAPRVTSFPEPLRRVQNVEVMVLLRRDGRALLWRSARGSSIARALLTAAQMARRRWMEREQTLGGSLDRLLPKLDVEVSLLHEDGTIGARDSSFVDRVFTPLHGVAYERRGSWHYLLPEATQRDGDGSASKAYGKLFEDNGLPASSLERDDLRLYRMVVTKLASSPKTERDDDDPARVATPDDVLGAVKTPVTTPPATAPAATAAAVNDADKLP